MPNPISQTQSVDALREAARSSSVPTRDAITRPANTGNTSRTAASANPCRGGGIAGTTPRWRASSATVRRAAPPGMPGLRRRGLGGRRLHRILRQLEAAGRLGEDDARGVQGLSPGKAHPPPRPPRRGERKREPRASGSRFSIDPGFLNASLAWVHIIR